MPNRSSKKKRPRDTNQLAKSIVDEATSDSAPPKESVKAESGRKGGQRGGRARAQKLTQKERVEIARKAAASRWQKKESG